jgi:hypothetical protein
MAKRPRSQPIHFRPSFSATASVVPDPQKKSDVSLALEPASPVRSRPPERGLVRKCWSHAQDRPHRMSPDQIRSALDQLGLTQQQHDEAERGIADEDGALEQGRLMYGVAFE